MVDIAKDLRRFAVEVATELSDETAVITVAVLTVAADEIEALLRVVGERGEQIERLRHQVEEWRADRAAAVIEVDRLQALIDAAAPLLPYWRDGEFVDGSDQQAIDALLAAATTKEDDR